jgi:mitochondrial import inner membrane translocase subunit TIM54
VNQLSRKMTIYLAPPPADGVMTAREHFHEYVKPVLVAAAMDWDAVEGRREGDVRAQLAERVRRLRKRNGEKSGEDIPEENDVEANVEEIRQRLGIRKSHGVEGDIVIGRHTWKEYVRGLHEGWLGPLDLPQEQKEEQEGDLMEINGNGNGNGEKPPPDRPHDIGSIPTYAAEKVLQRATAARHKDDKSSHPTTSDTTSNESDPSSLLSSDEASPTTKPPEEKDHDADSSSTPEATEKKKRKQPPPYISPSDYPSSSISPSTPAELPPSTTIPFPHILGFRNTPIRMYRFLTRRHLADDVGREVAAAVLAAYRPYHHSEGEFSPDLSDGDAASPTAGVDTGNSSTSVTWEQENLLKEEEKEWHKSVRKREEGDRKERTWLDPMVLDDRIAGRMQRFELSREDEERARRIGEGKEGPRKMVTDEEE